MNPKPGFFLFGGAFVRDLKPHLSRLGTVAGELLGISPLSDVQFFEEAGQFAPWLRELDTRLQVCRADHLILELEPAWHHLLVSGGCFLTAGSENLDALRRGEVDWVEPTLLKRERCMAAMDRLAQVVGRHFASGHVILIHSHTPDYWLAGNNLREYRKNRSASWMAELEKRFREKTGCAFVDVTRFYFLRKETGRKLTEAVFEEECYPDTAGRIEKILAGGDGSAGRPDFGLSLKRYVNYFFTLQKKPQRVFLNPEHFLDRVVLSASGAFVRAHCRELLELDGLDWREPEAALEKLPAGHPLLGILRAFWAAEQGIYGQARADYAAMLAGGLVPEKLLKELKIRYAPKAKLLPSQINRYNAGFHFARMRGLDPRPFVTEQTVPEPVAVDVFGSCISRTAFNVQDNDFVVENYWYHVPPFEHRNRPVSCDPGVFPEKPSWKDRMVKLQFDCKVNQSILDSRAKWLVVDLYALISPNNYLYRDCLYGDFERRISGLLGAKKVNLYRDTDVLGDRKAVIQEMTPWLELIAKKYGERIILVDGPRMDYWIGDDDRLYRDKRYTEGAFLEEAARYVCEKTGAYRIRIGDRFLSDELGYMRPTPAHKEDAFYRCCHDIIRYIVDNRPRQKVFGRYPGRVQMERLCRLTKHNAPELLEAALPLTELDRAVIRLGQRALRKYYDALTALYDSCGWDQSLETILQGLESEPELARLLKNSAQAEGQQMPEAPKDYPPYPKEQLRLLAPAGDCCLPEFPAVTSCKALWEKADIVLKWAAPRDTTVQVYRASRGEPWTWIGQSGEGSFRDKGVLPGVEYRYSLAVKMEQAGRTYVGGFTKPVCRTVAVGVPQLSGAVHIGEENTVRWAPVDGAEGYRVYRKGGPKERWQVAAVTEETRYTECNPAGTWYTVRALKTVKGKQYAGGFQPGVGAEPL